MDGLGVTIFGEYSPFYHYDHRYFMMLEREKALCPRFAPEEMICKFLGGGWCMAKVWKINMMLLHVNKTFFKGGSTAASLSVPVHGL